MTIKTNLPIVIGLACDTIRSSRTKRSCQSTGQDSSKNTGAWLGLDDKELHSVKVSLKVKMFLFKFAFFLSCIL